MRGMFLHSWSLAALRVMLIVSAPTCAWAQAPAPRGFITPLEPIVPTRIEALLASPNVVLVTDYYHIDLRFGPNLRIDAVIVEAVDSRTRLKGLRVQVRDPESRSRQDGTSYMDLDELVQLSRALGTMASLEPRWTNDDRQATESTFTTTGGFRIALRQSPRGPRAYLSTGLLDPVVTWIELADLPGLKQAFDQALTLLNGK